MYKKILNDVSSDPYYEQYSNDGQRFVAWYLRNIRGRDLIQTKHEITDGAHDNEMDAIVIVPEEQKIYIVQGKFIGKSSVDAAPLQEVLSAWVKLKSKESRTALQQVANAKLAVRLAEVASALDDDYDVQFELITTGALTPAALHDLGVFQAELAQADDFPAALDFVGPDELTQRYEEAQSKLSEPSLSHTIVLEAGKFLSMEVANTKIIIASLPLPECLKFPGVQDATLFRKNVRQMLGISNKVNKGIKSTIYNDKYRDFFFFHNGITAICDSLDFDVAKNTLTLKGLSVVNGCQSLTTLLHCSEQVKQQADSYMMFRFYEIPQRDRADKISINTNSQSTVKPRDLRTNDKRVLAIKKAYEIRYPTGYFVTKRGESAPQNKAPDHVVDFSELGKAIMAWHCQRPIISHNENKIFDKHFDQLFKPDYSPEDVLHLTRWFRVVSAGWNSDNPFGLNESLLALRSYAVFHHLYAVSVLFAKASNQPDRVPSPTASWKQVEQNGKLDQIVNLAAQCLNFALQTEADQASTDKKVFSPQNWLKAKASLTGTMQASSMQLMMLAGMPGGKDIKDALTLAPEHFAYRWSAE